MASFNQIRANATRFAEEWQDARRFYNTFLLPPLSDADKARLSVLGQTILDARAAFPDSCLADLYDRLTMPPALRKAHQALEVAVERLYRPQPFAADRARAEHLLTQYEALSAPLLATAQGKGKRSSLHPSAR